MLHDIMILPYYFHIIYIICIIYRLCRWYFLCYFKFSCPWEIDNLAENLKNLNSEEFNFFRFSAKLVQFYGKFLSMNMKIINNLENIIFTACKLCKLCKYYVNSMVISCSTFQKEEKESICVKYFIYAVLPQFQFCHDLRIFSAKF